MIRSVLSGVLIASSLTFAGSAYSDEVLRSAAKVQKSLPAAQAKDLRDEIQDLREARTPRERAEARAELRKEIGEESREAKKSPALLEGRASVTGAPPSRGGSLQSMVQHYAAANGVPQQLAHGVVMVESRYNARATGRGGYIGLMQIGYRTAKGMGYTGSRAGLYDPETNLRYGMKYLGQAYAQAGGNMCGTVSKYQGGHGVRGVTRAGAAYCGKVKKYMAQAAPVNRQVAMNVAPKS
jgi:soluble lytic murein transglycosylase-like protein